MIKFYKIIGIIVSFLIFGVINFLSFAIPLFLMFGSELSRDGIEDIPFTTLFIILIVLYLCKYIFSYILGCFFTKLKLFKMSKKFFIDKNFHILILRVFVGIDIVLFIYFLSGGLFSAIILLFVVSFSLLYLPFYFVIKNSMH